MPEKTEREADRFCRENIQITGLELAKSKVYEIDLRDIYRRVGRNDNPFIIPIPYNASSIESAVDYWPILCVRSATDIRKVATRATLTRDPYTVNDNFHPFELADKDGSKQIPFPATPDAPDNFYHRWWRWPKSQCWREPADYYLKIYLGYNRYQPAPVSEEDWISSPITYKIEIQNEKPPK